MTNPQVSGDAPEFRYTPALAAEIEQRWQDRWDADGTFNTPNPSGHLAHDGRDIRPELSANARVGRGQPFFIMDMFPYPSGKGLHVGHPLGYIATDVVGRYRRMRGDNVLHAIGYDAFGLPAEQYAMQTGQHPRVTTEANIKTMKRQLRRMGLAHDPRRTFATIDPEYVRWTQWIFLQIFNSWYDPDAIWTDADGRQHRGKARPIGELRKEYASGLRPLPTEYAGRSWAELSSEEQRDIIDAQRLAYSDSSPVNWAPGLGTVLANEEVINGRSERGNMPVFKKALRQWKMRITAYADRLIDDLELIDWPEPVKHMQRNWIGRSTGAFVQFDVGAPERPGVSTGSTPGGTTRTEAPRELNTSAASSCGPKGAQDPQTGGDAGPASRTLEVFTTRPDTLFGATFMVVAPEHDLLDTLPPEWPEGTPAVWTGGAATPAEAVAAYRKQAASKTDEDRMGDAGEKTGVFSGRFARNPLTGTDLPIFVADYVLMGYGTGAIMAVPGGDTRDYAFAKRYELPIIYTVVPDPDAPNQGLPEDFDEAWVEDGVVVNSAPTPLVSDAPTLNGMGIAEAKATATKWLADRDLGRAATTYRLRDWLFSRQRYWGEPFPVIWDENDRPVALPESMLPIELPDVPDYAPRTFDPEDADSSPEAPLGRNPNWVNVQLDLGDGLKTYRRDTNTMPNWAGSCWYYLRYLDPDWNDSTVVVDPELDRYWLGPHHNDSSAVAGGVDLYVGGVEHAVLHLLYARFWQKVLFDLGYSSALEPFGRLFNQGYIQAYAYTDERGAYVPANEVTGSEEEGYQWNGEPVNREFGKMGKSLKNIVTPDEMYANYGADTFRLYEMSMGPLDISRPWNTRDVVGAQRFLQRVWRNVVNENTGETEVSENPADEQTKRLVNRTIADVTEEMDGMRPNTAIAKLIQLNNHLTGVHPVPREAIEPLVLMLAPFAPHLAEELWHRLGHQDSLTYHPYPVADPKYLVEETVTCILQVKGKVRSRIEVPPSISDKDLEAAALADPGLQRAIDGKEIRKIIVRTPSVVNVVV